MNQEERRAYYLARYYTKRAWMISELGGKCARCGSTEGLEIDHIDASTKTLDVSRCWALSPEKIKEELKKCQVLCGDHHKQKSLEDGDCASGLSRHGTIHMYCKFKCRCEACCIVTSEYKRNRRRLRREAGLPRT